MRAIDLNNGNKIIVYESLREIPIINYINFQRALCFDLHAGSDTSDIFHHYDKLAEFIKKGMNKQALEELNNIYVTAFQSINDINTRTRCFYYLIHSINEEHIVRIDDQKIDESLKVLSGYGLTIEHVDDIIEDVKKKLTPKHLLFFLNSQTTLLSTNTTHD